MPKFHVSDDGVPRPCKAQSAGSCPVRSEDGESVPHGDFSSLQEAERFAEKVNEQRSAANSGQGLSKKKKVVEKPEEEPSKLAERIAADIEAIGNEADRDGSLAANMDATAEIAILKRELASVESVLALVDRDSRPEYVASIDSKHFGAGGAGSKFVDDRVANIDQLISLTSKQRGGLTGDDREALIAAGANPKDFAPESSGIRYLKVEVKGRQQLRSTASMADSDVIEVRAKGGNDGRPASLTFAAKGDPEEVSFATVVVGPKEDENRKPIPGPSTLYTAHPGIPTRGIRSDDVRGAGLDGGSKLTVGEFRKLFGRDIQINTY